LNAEFLVLVVFLGAFLAPMVARTLRMPVPVGELVFGLLLGQIVGSSAQIPEVIEFLAWFGFLLLMFLAGLEVDFNLLENTAGRKIALYTSYTALIFGCAVFLSLLTGFNLTVLLIASLVSVGLMLATLRDMGILNTPFAKRVMIVGVIGELVSLFVLTLMEKTARFHGWKEVLSEIALMGAFFVGFFFVFRLVKLLVWWFPEIVKRLIYEEDPSAIGIRFSLVLMFSSSVLARLSGIEDVLGAFLAGITLSFFLRRKHDLEERLSSIGYGFIIPIFFIKTGMGMDIRSLNLQLLTEVAIILLLMLTVRVIPAVFLLFAGFSLREILLCALLLSYPFTLMIAGTEIAHSSGLIEENTALSLLIGASLSSLLFPWSAKLLLRVLR
jgi:Kef-type K+ transport system membrane component KefB